MNPRRKNIIIEEFERLGFQNYYMQMFDKECEPSVRAYLLMKWLGMDQSTLGYVYTEDIVSILLQTPKEKHFLMEELYAEVVSKRNTKRSRIERTIRHAKECLLADIDEDVRKLVFGNYKNITIGNFLYSLVHFLRSIEY